MSTGAAEYRHFLKTQRTFTAEVAKTQAKATRHGETELAQLLADLVAVQAGPGGNFPQLMAMADTSLAVFDKVKTCVDALRSREFAHDEKRLRHSYASVALAIAKLAAAWRVEATGKARAPAASSDVVDLADSKRRGGS